ncbi:AZF1 [Candida pseudojiufengensis]|uniref:AZF1 n=1 Tax=Candida pseudojiufengensis TaxID=497109 RepID=UPI0022255FD4|nr:AZF1 [Candida pseudojiufengensis]KAI5963504.1 AZF1 [Candida pseudojiufengensis]
MGKSAITNNNFIPSSSINSLIPSSRNIYNSHNKTDSNTDYYIPSLSYNRNSFDFTDYNSQLNNNNNNYQICNNNNNNNNNNKLIGSSQSFENKNDQLLISNNKNINNNQRGVSYSDRNLTTGNLIYNNKDIKNTRSKSSQQHLIHSSNQYYLTPASNNTSPSQSIDHKYTSYMSYIQQSQQHPQNQQTMNHHSQQQPHHQQQQTMQNPQSFTNPYSSNSIYQQRSQQPSSQQTSPSIPQQQSQQHLASRARGDSIFLPPPITSKSNTDQAYETTSGNISQSNLLGSRSNSIFSSLINIPGSNGNSVSEPSSSMMHSQQQQQNQQPQQQNQQQQQQNEPFNSAGGNKSYTNNPIPNLPPTTTRSRQMSLIPNQEFTVEDLENLFGTNKESMANLFAWQQGDPKLSFSGLSAQNTGNNGKSKAGSIDLSAWMDGSNQPGSIGFSNSITEIVQNMISNGSLDLSNMSTQERRDSILKIINDQNNLRSQKNPTNANSNASANLRQDIFDKNKTSTIKEENSQQSPQVVYGQTQKREKDVSPTSSISSKASKPKDEAPQSPKTSPTMFNNSQTQDPYSNNQRPSMNSVSQKLFSNSINPISPNNSYPYSSFSSFNNSLGFQGMPSVGNRQNSFVGNYQYQIPPQSQPPQQMMPQQIRSSIPSQQPYQPISYPPQTISSFPQQQYYLPPQQQHQQQLFQQQHHQHPQQFQQQPLQQQQQIYQQPQQQQLSTASDNKRPRKQSTKRTRKSKDTLSTLPTPSVPENSNLVPAQQFAQSEDGRPLLGATKIDQLMLVIQAREKGVTKAINQGPDGSILASPEHYNQGPFDEDQSGVLPKPISLVGGVDKPHKPKHTIVKNEQPNQQTNIDENEDEEESRIKKRKTKNQQCPYCLKYFTQSTHLEVHIRSHIGYKPFECTYCHKKFTQGGNLRTHLRLHTGEKPFTCDVCTRSFNRKGNLEAHKLTHENVKPYECKLDNCDKSFTQLGNLKSHQNRFHLETLNSLTHKLAELNGDAINNLPIDEKNLLIYFKDLYKNSNKGIRGRGKQHKDEEKKANDGGNAADGK